MAITQLVCVYFLIVNLGRVNQVIVMTTYVLLFMHALLTTISTQKNISSGFSKTFKGVIDSELYATTWMLS